MKAIRASLWERGRAVGVRGQKVAAGGVQDVVLDLGVRGLGQVSLWEQRQLSARTKRGLRYRHTDGTTISCSRG